MRSSGWDPHPIGQASLIRRERDCKELTQRPSEDIGRRGHLQAEKRSQKKPALLASDLRLSSPEMRERSVCEAPILGVWLWQPERKHHITGNVLGTVTG